MSDLTPLEHLDEAVRAYVDATEGVGFVSGWVVAYETQTMTTEEGVLPIMTSFDYTMGAATSPTTAVGLLQVTLRVLQTELVSAYFDDGEESP